MTSGGDSPGMNSAVRAVVRSALKEGCEAYAIFEGYQGLVEGGDLIKNMAWADVRGFSVSSSVYLPASWSHYCSTDIESMV